MKQDNEQLARADLAGLLVTVIAQIETISGNLERMETRLDVLSEECERTASVVQRLLLRQRGLAQGVSRIESLLASR